MSTAELTAPRSRPKSLKEERLQRKLAKTLGLPRQASIAAVMNEVRALADDRCGNAKEKLQHSLSTEAAAQLGLAGRGEHSLGELVRLVTAVKAVPAGLAAHRVPNIVALSEPLEALRRQG